MSDEQGENGLTHELPPLIGLLIGLQNEVVYVIECIADDYTGEAKEGLRDVLKYLDEHDLPSKIDGAVRKVQVEAMDALLGTREVKRASRIMQRTRRQIANDIARHTGAPLPYAGAYYPTFLSL